MSHPIKHDLVVVAHRLPAEYQPATAAWQPWISGLTAALQPVIAARYGAWIGWSGVPDEQLPPYQTESIRLYPVRLFAQEITDHLDGQCATAIAPLYHGALQPPVFRRSWRQAYRAVNDRYARLAAEVAAPGGVVWIHDHHLQLVPELLRRLRPDLLIGFCLHTPFPPVELFTRMPLRREITCGLLGADVIGFQRPRSAANFLAVTAELLGLSASDGQLRVGNRRVLVRESDLPIDTDEIELLAADPDVLAHARTVRAELGGPRVVLLAVDRLDAAKGIEHRLTAYAELLAERRLDPEEVALVQVAVPGRPQSPAHRRLRERVEGQIGQINGAHARVGRAVVHYLHRQLDRRELVGLYRAADVMLTTPLCDGASPAAKEYVAARLDDTGALVLSEFTGTAAELPQSFVVNPYDLDALKDTLVRVVGTGPATLRRAMVGMRQRVRAHDANLWAGQFLTQLGGCVAGTVDPEAIMISSFPE